MAAMEDFRVHQDLDPVSRLTQGLINLGNQLWQLSDPVAATALSCFGVTAIVVSTTFQDLRSQWIQGFLMLGMCLNIALTVFLSFGTWYTGWIMNTGTRFNGALMAVCKFTTLCVLVLLTTISFSVGDYSLAIGLGTVAVQLQYLLRQQGYNIGRRNIIIGMVSIVAMIIVKEASSVRGMSMGVLMAVLAGLIYHLSR